jgi:hypothetical protein
VVDLEAWARSVADHVTHHMDTEREVLTRYGELANDTPDERLRYLIHLILDDEVRHHRLFAEMVNWLRASTEYRPLEGPRVPSDVTRLEGEGLLELRARTQELLAFERDDLDDLKELRREVTKVEDTAWWGALVDTMEHDTRKHIQLLEFIERQLLE